VLSATGPSSSVFLLRSEAAFLANRDSIGQAWHDSAVAYAHRDTTGALWERARLIASEEESRTYERLEPADRREFFTGFWGSRDPNLLTPINERLGEQTRRVAEARRMFRLLHPQRMFYRSAAYRALAWFEQRRWLFDLASDAPEVVGEGHSGAAESRAAALDYQSSMGTWAFLAYRAGLDARGLTFVRHGRPDVRVPCNPDPLRSIDISNCAGILTVEGWLYRTPDGPLSVGFGGAEYFMPVSNRQVRDISTLLRSDRSGLPAPLETQATVAFFRGDLLGSTDAYYRVGGDSAAVALWESTGREQARDAGRALLKVRAPAGTYRFGLDVDSSGLLGRDRGAVTLPWFDGGELKLSSLVLAVHGDSTNREGRLRAMPPDLVFDAGAALATYAEVYGLPPPGTDGRVHYRARYTFAPERSFIGRVLRPVTPVTFEFERSASGWPFIVEQLTLEPGRVPAGRYRVTLAVTDVERNVKSETVAIVVTIR
jgi:hypothetical protein